MKKIIFILILFLACYFIYNISLDNKIYYVSIGDFLSKGVNSYGVKVNGYSDYVRDYLYENNRLKEYNNIFCESDYRVTDVLRMIKYNDTREYNGKELNINRLIKEADVISLSVGMNELYYKLNKRDGNIYSYMNELINDMKELLEYINKFNHKRVYVLGYYNTYGYQEYIDYINIKLKNIVINEGFIYIDLANIFDNNPRLFDKKDSFIPNNQGYLKISEKIVAKIENN